MGVSKVEYGNKTLIDLSGDTVTASKMLKGTKAHDKNGDEITGTYEGGSSGTGTDTSDATAVASEILSGKTAYNYNGKVTGTMTNNGKMVGTISKKDEYCTIAKGYHDGTGTVKIPQSERDKIIGANIKSGVTILGEAGTYTGDATGTDTSDATATASDILLGKTAYANGAKVTGTIQSVNERTITPGAQDTIIQKGYYLSGNQLIKGDANLKKENIKNGVGIFGVTGSYKGESSGGDAGTGAYVWEKRDEKIGYVTTNESTNSTSKPSGYGTTKYNSCTVTEEGYYKLSNGYGLDEYYLPTGAENGKTKKIAKKPYGYNSKYVIMTLSDEKENTGKAGDTILGYISADAETTYPNCGMYGGVFYTMIHSPDVNVTAAKMLKGTIACGKEGKVTGTIESQTSQTITPTTQDQSIYSGKYLSGTQTIKGDANLKKENIKSGVDIFGVTGTYTG